MAIKVFIWFHLVTDISGHQLETYSCGVFIVVFTVWLARGRTLTAHTGSSGLRRHIADLGEPVKRDWLMVPKRLGPPHCPECGRLSSGTSASPARAV